MSSARGFSRLILLSASCLWAVGARAETCRSAPSQSRIQEQQVRALDKEWARAYAEGDVGAMERLLDDGVVVVSGAGALRDKAGELAELKPQPDFKTYFFRTEEVCVRVYGNLALVVGLAKWRINYKQQDIDHQPRYTSVYRKAGRQWRMINLQVSGPMARPPAP